MTAVRVVFLIPMHSNLRRGSTAKKQQLLVLRQPSFLTTSTSFSLIYFISPFSCRLHRVLGKPERLTPLFYVTVLIREQVNIAS